MSTPPVPASTAAVQALLQRVHPPARATEILTSQIQNHPLALVATPSAHNAPSPRAQRREARLRHSSSSSSSAAPSKRSRKPQPLSAKAKRALHVHDVDRRALQYDTFAPLHELWVRYARELVAQGGGGGGGGAMTVAQKLCAADFHGAVVEVVRSRDVGKVGIRGVVVKETRGAMLVVKRKEDGGGAKLLPKEYTVFRFEIPLEKTEGGTEERKMVFDLHGSQFMWRAADRANRKFKAKPMWDL